VVVCKATTSFSLLSSLLHIINNLTWHCMGRPTDVYQCTCSYETTSQPLYELLLPCNSLYFFLHAQIKEFYCFIRRLIRQLIVQVLCWVDQILCVNAWGDLSDDTNVLDLRIDSKTNNHARPISYVVGFVTMSHES
jgi:hypothetical protein